MSIIMQSFCLVLNLFAHTHTHTHIKDEKKTEEETNVKVIPNQPDEHPVKNQQTRELISSQKTLHKKK